MAIITQTNIDEAVLLAKSASYKLAYELTLEVKYGGKIGCCICNLKLLWLYIDALSCIEALDEDATPPITEDTNCLTQIQVKALIGKINSLVVKTRANALSDGVPLVFTSGQFDNSFSDSFA